MGDLVRGNWNPENTTYDSRATWQPDEPSRSIRLRLPWSMIGIADPSARMAFLPGPTPTTAPVPGIGLNVSADGSQERLDYSWPTWDALKVEERLAVGSEQLAAAYGELAP